MKISMICAAHCLALITTLSVVGCGFSNDSPVMDDPGAKTENGATTSDTVIDDGRNILPSDCLLAEDTHSVRYCFSPSTRELMAELTDCSIWWRFTLPGTDAENSIKYIVVADNLLTIVAKKGDPSFPQFEFSKFQLHGEFMATHDIQFLTTCCTLLANIDSVIGH